MIPSNDGTKLFIFHDGLMNKLDLKTNKVQTVFSPMTRIPCISSDDKKLAYIEKNSYPNKLVILNLENKTIELEKEFKSSQEHRHFSSDSLFCPQFVSNNSEIIFMISGINYYGGSDISNMMKLNIASEKIDIISNFDDALDLMVSPDGKVIAYIALDGKYNNRSLLKIFRLDSVENIKSFSYNDEDLLIIRWSPDSASIYLIIGNKLCEYRLDKGELVELKDEKGESILRL